MGLFDLLQQHQAEGSGLGDVLMSEAQKNYDNPELRAYITKRYPAQLQGNVPVSTPSDQDNLNNQASEDTADARLNQFLLEQSGDQPGANMNRHVADDLLYPVLKNLKK